MPKDSDLQSNAVLRTWIREQLDAAVGKINELQVFDDPFIESKPAWVLPMQILVGKVRAQSDPRSFSWFVCGEVPLDHVDAAAATSPREALRHFAMKWQIDASRLDPDAAASLIDDAQSLYNLTEDDRLWPA